MHEFPGPHERIRRILETALVDCTYVSSNTEDGSRLILQARRSDGRGLRLRFHGVRDSEADAQPQPGEALAVQSVKRENVSLVGRFLPILRLFKPPGPAYARVTIGAGTATLDIVCQDVEWWEE